MRNRTFIICSRHFFYYGTSINGKIFDLENFFAIWGGKFNSICFTDWPVHKLQVHKLIWLNLPPQMAKSFPDQMTFFTRANGYFFPFQKMQWQKKWLQQALLGHHESIMQKCRLTLWTDTKKMNQNVKMMSSLFIKVKMVISASLAALMPTKYVKSDAK